MSPSLLIGAALIASALSLAWTSVAGRRPAAAAGNLRRGLDSTFDLRAAALDASARDRVVTPAIAALARHALRITPAGMMTRLETKLVGSGMQGTWSIEQLLAVKLILTVLAGCVGLIQLAAGPSPIRIGVAVLAVGFGWFVPDAILDGKADERRQTVRKSLPDVMDQLTIAVEAGLGFEAALARVARGSSSVLATELARTLQDIQLGMARSDALDGLAQRLSSPELRHFVASVKQSERYGLPIANVLRIQAAELREKRRQRAEEQALKIPVKILFPLICFILPTLFIVILGPAVLHVATDFKS